MLLTLARSVRGEPGCVEFRVFESKHAEGHFYLYEIYASDAAFHAHLQQPHVAEFVTSLPSVSSSSQKNLVLLKELELT